MNVNDETVVKVISITVLIAFFVFVLATAKPCTFLQDKPDPTQQKIDRAIDYVYGKGSKPKD